MRLTYKYEETDGYGSVALKNMPNDPFVDKMSHLDRVWEEQRNKLGQLEDIEEELGIELLTLFKMLKNGFYIRTETGIIFIKNEDEWEKLKAYNEFTSEYGKTWALTKEELE